MDLIFLKDLSILRTHGHKGSWEILYDALQVLCQKIDIFHHLQYGLSVLCISFNYLLLMMIGSFGFCSCTLQIWWFGISTKVYSRNCQKKNGWQAWKLFFLFGWWWLVIIFVWTNHQFLIGSVPFTATWVFQDKGWSRFLQPFLHASPSFTTRNHSTSGSMYHKVDLSLQRWNSSDKMLFDLSSESSTKMVFN